MQWMTTGVVLACITIFFCTLPGYRVPAGLVITLLLIAIPTRLYDEYRERLEEQNNQYYTDGTYATLVLLAISLSFVAGVLFAGQKWEFLSRSAMGVAAISVLCMLCMNIVTVRKLVDILIGYFVKSYLFDS